MRWLLNVKFCNAEKYIPFIVGKFSFLDNWLKNNLQQDWLERCLLPHKSSQKKPELHCILMPSWHILISSNALWPLQRTISCSVYAGRRVPIPFKPWRDYIHGWYLGNVSHCGRAFAITWKTVGYILKKQPLRKTQKMSLSLALISVPGHSNRGRTHWGQKSFINDAGSFLIPNTPRQIQKFLRFVNFSWRFTPNFSDIVYKLQKMVKITVKIGTKTVQFDNLLRNTKAALKQNCINLNFHDQEQFLTLITYASKTSMWFFLVQSEILILTLDQTIDGRHNSNESRQLNGIYNYMLKEAEINYTTIERKFNGIVKSPLQVTYIIKSTKNKAVILTDHWNLLYLSELNIRRIRHMIF
jgi:hypothetical protein